MADWERPASVPYPSIWRTFQRNGSDGIERIYWIQDVAEEYTEPFLEQVVMGVIREEAISKGSNFIQDKESVDEFLESCRRLLQNKLSLVCLTRDIHGGIKIVGGNALQIYYTGVLAPVSKLKAKALHRVSSVERYFKSKKDIRAELNIDSYLMGAGIYVLADFRGQGIATELLKARRDLCVAVGIGVSITLFTSLTSQKCAARAGFVEFAEETYEELQKMDPEKWTFTGIPENTKSAKLMYADYRH